MFNIGSPSGSSSIGDKFNTVVGEKALKDLQDSKTSLSKLNEVTVGEFNKKMSERSAATTLSGKPIPLTDAERQDLIAKAAAANIQKFEKTTGLKTGAGYAEIEKGLLGDKIANGTITDAELKAMAAKYEPTIGDRLSQAADFATDCFNTTISTFTSECCAVAPFPQCASCPKRPKRKNMPDIPDFMKIIGDAISALTKSLEDAFTNIFGCPGLTAAVKTGLLTGSFDGLTNAVKANAMSVLTNTALKLGAMGPLKMIGDMMPDSMGGGMLGMVGNKVGGLIYYAGHGGYDHLCGIMTGASIAGDNLMKVAGYAKNGNINGAFQALTSGSRRSSRYTRHATNANISIFSATNAMSLSASNGSPTSIVSFFTKKTVKSAKSLTSAVGTRQIRSRARFSSAKIAALPGTTIDRSTLKAAYALDSIKTGTATPGDVKVRRSKTKRINALA